ncbi:MAG: hypothetical protein AAF293_06975 [Pseudomonadota bacterium]
MRAMSGALARTRYARYAALMKIVIAIGAVLSVVGLAGVIWCIRHAVWLRRAELDDTRVKAELNKLIFAHMAAIGSAFMGLGLLVMAWLLG